MATYEGGNAEGAPGRPAAGLSRGRTTARVRHHGGAAGGQRRAVRPADRHHLPGPAPPGTSRPDHGHLVAGGRAAAPRLRPDPRRAAHAGCRARNLAAVLRCRHRAAGSCPPAGDAMTGGPAVSAYLSAVAATMPGPPRARRDILA